MLSRMLNKREVNMGNTKYYIEVINNKIWAYKIIHKKEPNALVVPVDIYKAIKYELSLINMKIIVSDDCFEEIRCLYVYEL